MLVLTSLRITPCSHLREPSANLGKSMDWTSTFPGPAYTTPRLIAIYVHSNLKQIKTPLRRPLPPCDPARRSRRSLPPPRQPSHPVSAECRQRKARRGHVWKREFRRIGRPIANAAPDPWLRYRTRERLLPC